MSGLEEIVATICRAPLPERLGLIERASVEAGDDSSKPPAGIERKRTISLDEFVAARVTAPTGLGPFSLAERDRCLDC